MHPDMLEELRPYLDRIAVALERLADQQDRIARREETIDRAFYKSMKSRVVSNELQLRMDYADAMRSLEALYPDLKGGA